MGGLLSVPVQVEVVEFNCPFCAGRCQAPSPAQIERTPTGKAFLLHTEPACETFERLDVVAFLERVNDVTSGKGSRSLS